MMATRAALAPSLRGVPMRAARFHTDTGVLAVEEVSLPAPRPHEVRVKVGACGICLSDVHLIDGSLPTAAGGGDAGPRGGGRDRGPRG